MEELRASGARRSGGSAEAASGGCSPHGDGESFQCAVSAALARVTEAHEWELERLRRQLAAAACTVARPLCEEGAVPGQPGEDNAEQVLPSELPGGEHQNLGHPPEACCVEPKPPPRPPFPEWSLDADRWSGPIPLDTEKKAAPQQTSHASSTSGIKAPPQWQWLHRTGWRDYRLDESVKIEKAFKRGDSKVLLKSGKQSCHPMEIFFHDMVQHDQSTGSVRDVRRQRPMALWKRLRRRALTYYRVWETGRPRDESFQRYRREWTSFRPEAESRKIPRVLSSDSARGRAAALTQSQWFQTGSTLLILLNAIWILYEVDHNDALEPSGYASGFLAVEYTFCSLFFLEVFARFVSFARVRDCCGDYWFLFDSCCTFAYVSEIWLLPLFKMSLGDEWSSENSWPLRILRVIRLFRLARVSRLVRVVPEFVVMLKGFFAAVRSVIYTLVLWFGVVYLCAVSFRSQVKPDGFLESRYFSNVGHAMSTLILHGTLLDSISDVAEYVYNESLSLTACFVIYVFITNCAILNMLIGIICNVVTRVQEQETDQRDMNKLTALISDIMEVYDKDCTDTLCKDEFELFVSNPEVRRVLKEFSVDAWGLSRIVNYVSWKNQAIPGSMAFADIMALILRMRDGGSLKLLDVLELRHVVEKRFERLEEKVESVLKS